MMLDFQLFRSIFPQSSSVQKLTFYYMGSHIQLQKTLKVRIKARNGRLH